MTTARAAAMRKGWGGRYSTLLVALLVSACASGGTYAPDPIDLAYDESLGVDFSRMERGPSGLWFQDLVVGEGATASSGDRVRIHYIGRLPDGTVVDASVGGEAVAFELGSNEVIRGWNEGIRGMKVGGQRRLVLRPGLAYGRSGVPGMVPPESVIVFEIQLLDAL